MQRLTLVCAPTGYGKTSTFADWLGDDVSGPFPVRWVHCTHHHPDVLWNAIAAILQPLTGAPVTAHDSGAEFVLSLARNLSSGLTLVVDDYQIATSAETDLALARLSAASPHLSVVVIGRRVTVLDGPLVSATTRVRLIGVDDLRLTPEESLALADQLRLPRGPNLAAALERADGWPLAIRAALNLGSDALYTDSPDGRVWAGAPAAQQFDPLANLGAFALGSLEVLSPAARTVALAASQIDSLSLAQIRDVLGADAPAATQTVEHLTELGYLVPLSGGMATEYRCHRAVRTPFAEVATDSIALAERRQLYSGRAAEIAVTAPFTAFRLYCAGENYSDAEVVLAHNFTTLTDEGAECLNILRALPETALHDYPTLTAALLFLEYPLTGGSPTRLRYLLRLWQIGLERKLAADGPTAPGPLQLHYLCEAMVMNRVLGNLPAAQELLVQIEARLSPEQASPAGVSVLTPAAVHGGTEGRGSLSVFYRELAATALSFGDFRRARRNLKRLRRHSERKIAAPWHGFPHASIRTVTDAQSGANWLLAALSELAFTDVVDGHIRRADGLIREFDEVASATGAVAPGISWVGAEVARAFLAQERNDSARLAEASERLALVGDRLEPWPLLLIAQSASIRATGGIELALAHLVSGLSDGIRLAPVPRAWFSYVVQFEAMLNSSLGNLARAAQLLAEDPSDSPALRLEQARLAVFSGDDVEALLIAQGVGDPGTTKRQRVDRWLLTAVAAWCCDRPGDAIAALGQAAERIDKYFLPAMLASVPFEPLREVAIAARDAGVCDVVALVEAIPEPARAHRYEQLTEMELRTLAAIAEHRNAGLAAESLFVTAGTVKKHLAAVYRKLQVRDRDSAILRAGRMGLLSQGEPHAADV